MKSEAAVQQAIRLAAPSHGTILWRNNNGACQASDGRQIRYGIANDSQQMNKEIKSSDLIGITKKLVTPDMVNSYVGVFTSYEVKREGWVWTGAAREIAQNSWLNIIRQWGGKAGFATGVHDIWGTGV